MELALPQRTPFNAGLALSIAAHVLIVLWLALNFANPQPLAPPVDLSNAIAISMEPYRPKPPEPPKPPKPPKNVVTTTAPEPDVSIPQETTTTTETAPVEEQPATQGTPTTASYASLVAGVLQRNKRYPRAALTNHIEGTVLAYFVVNHQGHVIGYRIERPSGHLELDQEVVRLLKAVSFPEIPSDGGDPERREFTLPLEFKIEG